MIDVVLSPEAAALREQLRQGGMLPASAPAETTEPPRNGHHAKERSGSEKRKTNPQITGRFNDMNAFIDVTMATLTRAEITTWFALFRFNQSKLGTSRASVETIAQRAGTSKRHTLKAITSLMEKGLVERVVTGGINRGSSVYRVNPLVTRRSPSTGNQ